jgi:hypothetical protein
MSAEDTGRAAGKLWASSSAVGKVVFFGGIVALLTMCFSSTTVQKTPGPTPKPVAKEAPPDPAIVARKQKEEATFMKTAIFARSVKQALRDPDSLVWEDMRANDDATVICLEYRARNGFGGMNREFAVYGGGEVSQKPAAWNKYCTQPLADMKYVRHALK